MKHIRIIITGLALVCAVGLLAACEQGKDQETTAETGLATHPITESAELTESSTETPTEPETYYFVDNVAPETESQAPETKPDEYYEYTQDFSKPISANDPDWAINEMADTSKGYLTATGSQHPYVAIKHKAKADVVTVTVDLKANRPGAIPNDSGYIALRLPKYDDQFAAVGQNGIWLTFQCSRVGIINGWPNITLFESGFDFTKTRTVTVEDNQTDNIISVLLSLCRPGECEQCHREGSGA